MHRHPDVTRIRGWREGGGPGLLQTNWGSALDHMETQKEGSPDGEFTPPALGTSTSCLGEQKAGRCG